MAKTLTSGAWATAFLLLSSTLQANCDTLSPEEEQATPDIQLTDNGDGTISDLSSGLMWTQCSVGQTAQQAQCSGTATQLTWGQALLIPGEFNLDEGYAGHNNWRLPNIKELRSLAEEACADPAINPTLFPHTESDLYWSSTASADAPTTSWGVHFDDGRSVVSDRSNSNYVRLVREPQQVE